MSKSTKIGHKIRKNSKWGFSKSQLIKTNNGDPVLKSENTNNYLEYRFGVGVS